MPSSIRSFNRRGSESKRLTAASHIGVNRTKCRCEAEPAPKTRSLRLGDVLIAAPLQLRYLWPRLSLHSVNSRSLRVCAEFLAIEVCSET
jgi:hypothetical protein